jgi:predicted MFS family arabinose efflux permease
LTVSALGSLLGALLARRIEGRLGTTPTLRFMLGLGAVAYVALALTTQPAAVAGLLGVYFFHTSVWTVCFASLRQRLIPDRLMGRVSGAMRSCALAGLVVGAVLGGVVATRFGLQSPFWLGAGLLVVALLLPLGKVAQTQAAEPAHAP